MLCIRSSKIQENFNYDIMTEYPRGCKLTYDLLKVGGVRVCV